MAFGCLTTKPIGVPYHWIWPSLYTVDSWWKWNWRPRPLPQQLSLGNINESLFMEGVSNTRCIAKHFRFLHCLIWQLLMGLSHALGWPVSKPWKSTVRIGLLHCIMTVACMEYARQHIQIYIVRLMNPSMWSDNHGGHWNHPTLFPSVHLQVFFMVVVGQWRNTTPFDNTYMIYVCRFKFLSSTNGTSLFLSYEN